MKRMLWKTVCVVLVLVLTACQPDKKQSKVRVASKGLPYELLLVVEDSIWDSEAGDSLKGVLQGSVPGLPQNEPMFRLLRVAPQNYVRNYVTLRNIMFVKVNDSIDNARIGMAYNVEAAPQICMRVDAPDIHSLAQFVGRNKERITDEFVNSELALETARLRKKYNKEVDAASRAIFGYGVNVPVDLAALKKRSLSVHPSVEPRSFTILVTRARSSGVASKRGWNRAIRLSQLATSLVARRFSMSVLILSFISLEGILSIYDMAVPKSSSTSSDVSTPLS